MPPADEKVYLHFLPHEIALTILKKLDFKTAARTMQSNKKIKITMERFQKFDYCRAMISSFEMREKKFNELLIRCHSFCQIALHDDPLLGYNPMIWAWNRRLEQTEKFLKREEADRIRLLAEMLSSSWHASYPLMTVDK